MALSLLSLINFPCSFSLSIFFIIVLSILLKHYKGYKHITKKKLPPGEMGLPWIGETIEFYKAQKKNKLFEEFVQPRMEKYGKTFKTRLMGSPTVVVCGAEANMFFLSNEFKLVISSWPTSSVELMGKNCIMEKQGEAHRRLRGIISSSLASFSLDAMVPKICNTIQSHLDKNCNGQDQIIKLYHLTKCLTFKIVFECFLGIVVKPGLLETFERVLEGAFSPPFKFPGSKFSRAKNARLKIEKILVEVIREKRREIELGEEKEGKLDEALLSQLVKALIRGEVSEEEVADNVVLLVFAAHDTTSFAIAMTFRMLAHHPTCYSLLIQEHANIMNNKGSDEILSLEDTKKMKYTWQVARESMRLFPPIFGSFRKAIADIEFEGFTIPKGWKVLWTTYGTHYSPEYFKEPQNFDPSRFEEPVQPYAFVPFGGGPRLCAGYQLAKLNILIFVHYVVTRYDWSLINPDEPIVMDPLPFPSKGMPIKISPKF
ncbi:PREDICTED: taxadiene 5-alpha hydroxylase [Nicotiana attenuata]|uniref:Taxadiene 5-alpha hydroxylase n=1 Tax=Nicotiana attenuata TaxID=49451 RepID=A0A314KT69_NICAT|nr:PREDICTED: taxadiene 5-alpha hydroxylase [Nicotiana attenuata]OIT32297.1 taxadiene 5-alpha hydroxylase [Nicotiana attenuata]